MRSQRLSNSSKTIKEFTIKGLVQGIGYRPFIAELASELGLDGFVRNTDGIVTVCFSGDEAEEKNFRERILSDGPSQAKVTSITSLDAKKEDADLIREGQFYISESNTDKTTGIPYIPSDIATCESCKRELFESENRRYRHPFISCTDCGPRYSIIEALPYDRPRITMKPFDLCSECYKEYISTKTEIAGNRRRHAQTIACKNCGPRLSYWSDSEAILFDDTKSIEKAVSAIKAGKIVATMDIGGFHLSCDATNDDAVSLLRKIKRRTRKPFAVLFSELSDVKKVASVSIEEEKLLTNSARPVVLLDIKSSDNISKEVIKNSPYIGAMLPCNPLQIILAKECGRLVMTSANYSGDLMITDPEEMKQFSLENGSEIEVLYHNRPILTPLDDSVVKITAKKQQMIRRARGYVPEPIWIKGQDDMPQIFATGGDMKSTFGFFAEGKAYLSQPFGDMELEEVQAAYDFEVERNKDLFGFAPSKYACDRHPGYFTRKRAKNNPAEIYHHQAHIASVIMEHDIKGEVIGLAFDGTGYGIDKTIHGSEFYHWNGSKMSRFASLEPVELQGGADGVRNADTILAGFIKELPVESSEETKKRHVEVRKILGMGLNTIVSSSMGRLFDAASALLDICHYSEYEGEAAIELEYLASKAKKAENLHISIEKDEIFHGKSIKLLEDICEKKNEGAKCDELALGFIEAIAKWSVETVNIYRKENNVATNQIVLSGGTFQNRILMEKVVAYMEKDGYKVYTNEQVSPGDAGIALGQMYLARF